MTFASQKVTVARGFHIDPVKALTFGILCWIGFGAVVWAVQTGHGENIDRIGLLFWRDSDLKPTGPAWLLELVRCITILGGVPFRYLFALAAAIALALISLRREAALLVLTIITGWGANSLLKELFGRPRPQIVPHLAEADGMSFPSGHSFNAAVVYIATALALAALSPRQSVRVTVVAAAVLVSMAIAWSRVWLGVHFPSDAIAGWLGGAGWTFMASALLYNPAAHKLTVTS